MGCSTGLHSDVDDFTWHQFLELHRDRLPVEVIHVAVADSRNDSDYVALAPSLYALSFDAIDDEETLGLRIFAFQLSTSSKSSSGGTSFSSGWTTVSALS